MVSLRLLFLLLALLSGGLAQASYSFNDAPRASDEELDRMRGGFIVSWNGLEFLMPFSIDGIERLTQINGQTYINGELMSASLNPRALIPFSQTGQINVNVQTPVLAAVPPAQTASGPDAASPGTGSTDPGAAGDSPAASADVASSAATGGAGGTGSAGSSSSNTQVTTNGSLILIQNGTANAVALPSSVSLDSLATFIQNSVNNQVIRNITTLNITLEAQRLAMQARLNAIHNQGLNGLR